MITRPNTLSDLPAVAARRFGDKVALHAADRQFTFLEIEARIRACAGGLVRLGVRPGDRVVLHLPNTWQWIVAYYAIARAGAVVVPANILLVSEEVGFIAEDCGAAALVVPADRIQSIRAVAQQAAPHFISVGDGNADGAMDWEDLCKATPLTDAPIIPSSAISTIGYTSGTTGRTKGAVLTHAAVMMNTAMTANMHVRTAADTVVTALPCSHVYGNVVMNGAFLCGYQLVLMERFEAEQALDAIARHQATLFEGVPTMYYYLLSCSRFDDRTLHSLTRATVGGQTMPLPQLQEARRRLGCPLIELWGMTEIAGLGTTHPLYGPERLGSIGLALPYSECRVADLQDSTRAMPVGESGELIFRGPTVMQGYYGRPDASAEVMLPGGWLRTGDVAYRDEDGYFFVVDRVKEMIITAGYNVYPSELERVIAAHPAIQIVAVGGVPDEAKGELAIAYVVLKMGAQVDEKSLLDYCRQHLAAYKVPKGVRFVPEVPKTSTGKIMRRALRTLSA